MACLVVSYPVYLQLEQAKILMKRQIPYGINYIFRNPHKLFKHILRAYSLTLVFFNLLLLPTLLAVLAAGVFGIYALGDLI